MTPQQSPPAGHEFGIIKGTVFDPNGKRLEGARVYAEGDNYPPISRPHTVTTNPNGEFVLEDVIPGKNIGIHAYKESENYTDVIALFDVPPKWEMPHLEVKPGQTVTGITVRLMPKAGKLHLLVRDADTKELVHGIYLQLCRADHPTEVGYCLTGSGPSDFEHSVPPGVGISIKVSSDKHGNSDYQWRYRDAKTGSPYFIAKSGEPETMTVYVSVPKN